MIKQESRDELKSLMVRGDIPRAKVIYRVNTGKVISESYLQMFSTGERKNMGSGQHKPEDIYQALAEAVNERLERQARIQRLADEINKSTRAAAAAAAGS